MAIRNDIAVYGDHAGPLSSHGLFNVSSWFHFRQFFLDLQLHLLGSRKDFRILRRREED